MQIGELADQTGLSRDTLRFYEKRGLLVARRQENGYRDYPVQAIEWLRYVRTAQSLGFTLAEIEADRDLLANPALSGPRLQSALEGKLVDIDRRIQGLTRLREDVARRLEGPMIDCPLRSRV